MVYRMEVETVYEVGQNAVEERSSTISVASAGVRPSKLEQDAGYEKEYFLVKR